MQKGCGSGFGFRPCYLGRATARGSGCAPDGSREAGQEVTAACSRLAARGSRPSAAGTRTASRKLATLSAVLASATGRRSASYVANKPGPARPAHAEKQVLVSLASNMMHDDRAHLIMSVSRQENWLLTRWVVIHIRARALLGAIERRSGQWWSQTTSVRICR